MIMLHRLPLIGFLFASGLFAVEPAGGPNPVEFNFNDSAILSADWKTEGQVAIETADAYSGAHALRLERALENVHLPASATSPVFPLSAGIWKAGSAGKVSIFSPDNSFNGKVWLECLDPAGKVVDRFTVGEFDRNTSWQVMSRNVEIPARVTSGRFRVEMNKTHGKFWVDALTAAYVGAGRSQTQTVDRILFSTAQMGNLLYPDDPRTVKVEVSAFRPLSEQGRTLSWSVRDYWGAELAAPATVPLRPTGDQAYEAVIDLSSLPLEMGRYYEIHASVPQVDTEPATNHSSFAILPEAVTKKYPAKDVPFTSRNWDNRIEEFYPLTDRLGIRICGIWGRWSAEPPYEARVPRIDLVEKYGMGALTTTPIASIEHRTQGWEKFDEASLRLGIRNLIAAIGDVRPLVINLGNEPPDNPEVAKRAVAAYKIVYQEIKKIDPSIIVVGSSAGTLEEYFRLGFGEWCDAYDFHTYEDSKYIRGILARYQELFKKYGHPRPVWATEVGLNSQGLERRVVSVDMIKKFTSFFAAGGANVSWFGLLYPDPELKLHGGAEDAHNVFDCRYKRYAPRLDAVTYYHMVNAIAVKKFVEETTYPSGIYAALFRDDQAQALQVLWKEDGVEDVFLPLPEVGKVVVTHIDGRQRELHAADGGVTLSIGPDPVLLTYAAAKGGLAPALKTPAAQVDRANLSRFVQGGSAVVPVRAAENITLDLEAPALWKTSRERTGGEMRFILAPPPASKVREADLAILLKDKEGRITGELLVRPIVEGRLAVRVLPEPVRSGGTAGVRVQLTNNGPSELTATWELILVEELNLEKGKFGAPAGPLARLDKPSSGELSLKPGESQSVVVALQDFDPTKLYRVKTLVRESTGEVVEMDRLVGGFVGVPRGTPSLDGNLDDPAWKAALPQKIAGGNHYLALKKDSGTWTGPEDLSATMKFLWDDEYLYVGVEVTDDLPGKLEKDSMIWRQDGLQFLIDPAREMKSKPGKYDYAVAVGSKGPQAWSYLTADSVKAPVNEAGDFRVAVKRRADTSGSMTYEAAIPWTRISPFRPAPGKNLGLTMILNEDDGPGRDSFMAWFGNAHTKQVDTAGDLILLGNE